MIADACWQPHFRSPTLLRLCQTDPRRAGPWRCSDRTSGGSSLDAIDGSPILDIKPYRLIFDEPPMESGGEGGDDRPSELRPDG